MKPRRTWLVILVLSISASAWAQDPPAPAPRQPAQPRRQAGPTDRDRSITTPGTVKVARDVVFATYSKREVKLDLYLPAKPPAGSSPW